MSKHYRAFLDTADSKTLWGTGLVILQLKRGRRILVKPPYTKRGTPNLKAQKHLISLGIKRGVFWS